MIRFISLILVGVFAFFSHHFAVAGQAGLAAYYGACMVVAAIWSNR